MGSSNNLSSDDKLLLAAIDLIAEKGYNGVSTKEIAAAAGLSEKNAVSPLRQQAKSSRNCF